MMVVTTETGSLVSTNVIKPLLCSIEYIYIYIYMAVNNLINILLCSIEYLYIYIIFKTNFVGYIKLYNNMMKYSEKIKNLLHY